MRSSIRSGAAASEPPGSGAIMRQWRSGASGESASQCGSAKNRERQPEDDIGGPAALPGRNRRAEALVELEPGDQKQELALEDREAEGPRAADQRRREPRGGVGADAIRKGTARALFDPPREAAHRCDQPVPVQLVPARQPGRRLGPCGVPGRVHAGTVTCWDASKTGAGPLRSSSTLSVPSTRSRSK